MSTFRFTAAMLLAGSLLPAAAPSVAFAEQGVEAELATESDEAPAWTFTPTGYLRLGYRHVMRDENVDFIGRNNGFDIANARIGLLADHEDAGVQFKLTVDGAVDRDRGINTPEGSIDVALRDAFIRYTPGYVAFQVGQFQAPFTAESMLSTGALPFIDRAVGEAGVDAGTGFELRGLDLSRQRGAMISTDGVIEAGVIYLGAWAMVADGNGSNQQFNDNGRFAFYGRVQAGLFDILTLGFSGYLNDRTEGDRPVQFVEKDRTWALDLAVEWIDLHAYFELIRQRTIFDTVGTPDRDQRAWHAQLTYDIRLDKLTITPGYRFASFDPFANVDSDSTIDLDTFGIRHHTASVVVHRELDDVNLGVHLEYTHAAEESGRELNNDMLSGLVRVAF